MNLPDEIARVAASINLHEHRLVKLIAEFDEDGGWARQGAVSCAHWLSWRIGLGVVAAREKVRVGRALERLPAIDAAFEAGKVSYSKVRAMTRVATPDNDVLLAEMAQHTTAAELEQICRRFRGVQDESPRGVEEAEARRFVRVARGPDGAVRLSVQVPADEGARLLAALDAAASVDDSAESPRAPNRADGLMHLVESWFADGPRPRRGGAPHEVVLHVGERTGADPYLEHDDRAVSDAAAKRIACDASLVDVGRKHRTVPPAMRRALEARHGKRCAFPTCNHRLFLDAHHIQHWMDGGATQLDNLVLLCRRHHTFVHEHGWRIEKTDDHVAFVAPEGPVPRVGDTDRVDLAALARREDAPGDLDAWALRPDFWGDPVDYDQVIHALATATIPRNREDTTASVPARIQVS